MITLSNSIMALLALAPAPSQPGTQPDPRAQMMQTLGMLVLMGIIFYFLLIRPQQKKAKEHAALLKTLRIGDKVLTSGGIVGIVVGLKDKDRTVSIRSADTKLEILKSAVTEITERGKESNGSSD